MQFSPDDVLSLFPARKGHFLPESGHHGDLWLDLELLCRYPNRIRPLCAALAKQLQQFELNAVCGPLVEGAFVALIVASELDISFSYSERFTKTSKDDFFPAGYSVPNSLRHAVKGTRIAIVNDVINAGSAVRGTFEDLEACGADIVAIGTLLTLGNAAQEFAATKYVALESLVHLPNNLWVPAACPLCATGIPLEDAAGFRNALAGRSSAVQ
jgi:orotate phosphoribosyltransferase